VAAPHPAQAGAWAADLLDPAAAMTGGAWRFMDPQGQQRGFVLTGAQTSRRMELAKATAP
jgi:rubredoxin-NAD+ reductase